MQQMRRYSERGLSREFHDSAQGIAVLSTPAKREPHAFRTQSFLRPHETFSELSARVYDHVVQKTRSFPSSILWREALRPRFASKEKDRSIK